MFLFGNARLQERNDTRGYFMRPIDALITYENGNISAFKEWLFNCSKAELVAITALFINEKKSYSQLITWLVGKNANDN